MVKVTPLAVADTKNELKVPLYDLKEFFIEVKGCLNFLCGLISSCNEILKHFS
jgi:hypothetical protein